MQDPYLKLLSQMRKQGKSVNPPGIRLAEVVAPPPNIVIKMGDLQVDKDNILIADYLLPGYKRTASQNRTGSITSHDDGDPREYNPYTEIEELTHYGSIEFTDTLQAGDIVVAIPTEDGQTYIILAKVVGLA